MKTLISILLLLTIAVRSIYSLGYMIYFEWNLEEIVTTYCINKDKPVLKCQGKCYLKKQLTLVNPESEKTVKSSAVAQKTGYKIIFTPLYFENTSSFFKLANISIENTDKEIRSFLDLPTSLWTLKVPCPPPDRFWI